MMELYDTTLRDGTQGEGVCLTLKDKLRITSLLDSFGMHLIEGGWPGSNPKDAEYFSALQDMNLTRTGMTMGTMLDSLMDVLHQAARRRTASPI